jgi:hypothetical protein
MSQTGALLWYRTINVRLPAKIRPAFCVQCNHARLLLTIVKHPCKMGTLLWLILHR